MSHLAFSKKEAVLFGWETFKKNWKFLALVYAILILVQALLPQGQSQPGQQMTVQFGIAMIVRVIVQAFVTIATTKIALNFVDHKKSELSDVYRHYKYLGNVLLVSAIFILASSLLGFLGPLSIILVPVGIYLGIRLQFYSYLIIDKNLNAIDSLKASFALTKGHVINLILLAVIFIGIILLGFIALVVGILAAWPVVSLATAYVYRKLAHKG